MDKIDFELWFRNKFKDPIHQKSVENILANPEEYDYKFWWKQYCKTIGTHPTIIPSLAKTAPVKEYRRTINA